MEISVEPLTVRSVVSRFYSSWAAGKNVRRDIRVAASSIIRCRTAALGAHVSRCDCGHITNIQYNSCRHRSCPQCRGGRRADWLHRTTADLLPCEHVHIIFTVPEQLNSLLAIQSSGLLRATAESRPTDARNAARRSEVSRSETGNYFGSAYLGTQSQYSSARALPGHRRWRRCGRPVRASSS